MKKTLALLVSTIMLGMSACAVAEPSNQWKHDHRDRYDHRYDRYDHRKDQRKPPHWSNADRGNLMDNVLHLNVVNVYLLSSAIAVM